MSWVLEWSDSCLTYVLSISCERFFSPAGLDQMGFVVRTEAVVRLPALRLGFDLCHWVLCPNESTYAVEERHGAFVLTE
jgi:hypothetical protein